MAGGGGGPDGPEEPAAQRVGRFLRKRRVECGQLGDPALPGVLVGVGVRHAKPSLIDAYVPLACDHENAGSQVAGDCD